MLSKGFNCLLLVCVCGCASDQPVMNRLSRMESMQQTERSESVAEYDALKQELDAVRNRLDAVSKAQADLMAAMDRQNELLQNAIQKLEHSNSGSQRMTVTPTTPMYGSGTTQNAGITDGDPDQRPEVVYQTAYNDYINRNYDLAVLEFQSFMSAFPDSDLADNAQYWIGECYYSQQKYDEALTEFNKVLQKYPNGDKYIPAMLKKGLCLIEKGNLQSGRSVLEKLTEDYPYSTEARIAEDRLANP